MSTLAARRPSIVLAGLVALALAASMFFVSGNAAPAQATLVSSSTVDPGPSFAHRILRIVNHKRANHGRRPLRAQECVSHYARHWGRHLARVNGWYHSDLYRLLDRCNMTGAAENLAEYPDGMTPRQVVRLWMQSSGHRKNLLNNSYGLTGVAVVWDSDQQVWYAVQEFAHR